MQHDYNNNNGTSYIEYIIPDALPSAGSVVVPYRINCHSDNVKTKNNQDNNINEINILIFVRFYHWKNISTSNLFENAGYITCHRIVKPIFPSSHDFYRLLTINVYVLM